MDRCRARISVYLLARRHSRNSRAAQTVVKRLLLVFSVVFLGSLSLAGCDTESASGGASAQVLLTVPNAAQYPPTGRVRAVVTVDGGPRIELNVNQTTGTISGIVPVSIGQHTIVITLEFVFNDTAVSDVVLATYTQIVDVSGGQTNITFTQSDYVFPNDDTDEYANLGEVLAGTDPFDGNDKPIEGPLGLETSGLWNLMRWGASNWQ